MRNTKKAFTLVELIVVITILAILATVAFVSLGGQTDNARNTVKKDKIGKLATSIENARTNGLSLSAFASGVTANQISGNIAGTWVTVSKNYNAWDVNLTALDVKAEDFKDGETNSFKYGYTTKAGGKYELAATIKEGDLQKAYVVGTFEPRTILWTTISWTWKLLPWSTTKSTFLIANTTNIKKLGYWDYVTNDANSNTFKIIAVSPDYMTLTIDWDIDGATVIELATDDSKWLIKSTDTSWAPVQNDSEFVPYTLQ